MPDNTSRIGLKVLAAAVVLIGAGLTAAYFLRPVAQVVLVKRGKAVSGKPGSVVVQAEREADLKSEYGGRILRSMLRPGTRFKAGEFLVQLDTHELELEIQRTQSDMESAQKRIAAGSTFDAQIANARDDVATKERQFKLGSLSETDYTQAKRAVEQLEQSRDLGAPRQPAEARQPEEFPELRAAAALPHDPHRPVRRGRVRGLCRQGRHHRRQCPHRPSHHHQPARRGQGQRGGLRQHPRRARRPRFAS